MIIYARSVTMRRYKDRHGRERLRAEYIDLVYEPGTPSYYGLFDPTAGQWCVEGDRLAIFDESECLKRLSVWEDWHRADAQGNLRQITLDGYVWLNSAAGQDLSAQGEHGIYTREVPQPLLGLYPGERSQA